MNKDLLKTIGGILVIGVVVVSTFLYGNQQRQEQQRRDQEVADQQQQISDTEQTQTTPSSPQNVGGGALPATTPSTGSADSLLPVAVLSTVGGLYVVQRRQLKQALARR